MYKTAKTKRYTTYLNQEELQPKKITESSKCSYRNVLNSIDSLANLAGWTDIISCLLKPNFYLAFLKIRRLLLTSALFRDTK